MDDARSLGALRGRVLAAALARRGGQTATATFVDPYAAATVRLDERLRGLTPAQWRTRAVGDWSVRDIVAHLGALDRLVHAQLTGAPPSVGAGDAVSRRTAEAIAAERGRTPGQTRAGWRAGADRLVSVAATPGLAGEVRLGPMVLSVHGALLQRAFETWMHSEDVAAALGQPAATPPPGHVWQLANEAVEALPVLLGRAGRAAPGRSLRLVLTGPGGGDWLVPLEPGAEVGVPDTEVTLDVLEFCFVVADRRRPRDMPVGVSGDDRLAGDLLAAASGFAGP
jgi:uncharacterized protein (TIGR03083 family)